MGELLSNEDAPFAAAGPAAAAIICRTEHGNLHAGLVYKRSSGNVLFFHLARKDDLQTEWKYPFLWVTPPLPPEKLFHIGTWCQRIVARFRKHGTFPYGLHYDEPSFREDASLDPGLEGTGVSCGTIILAILKSVGLTLIDRKSWPERQQEDIEWAKSLPPSLRDTILPQLRAGNILRIRAEEVIGACTCTPPVDFPTCTSASAVVLRLVTEKATAVKAERES